MQIQINITTASHKTLQWGGYNNLVKRIKLALVPMFLLITLTVSSAYASNAPVQLTTVTHTVTTQDKEQYTEWVYPVGSIYMNTADVDPASIFGGEWERMEGRFLLGADSNYTAGDTGGEATHKLTVNEIPSHNHVHDNVYGAQVWLSNYEARGGLKGVNITSGTTGYWTSSIQTANTGGSQPHNNMPPYVVVYMWKRIR